MFFCSNANPLGSHLINIIVLCQSREMFYRIPELLEPCFVYTCVFVCRSCLGKAAITPGTRINVFVTTVWQTPPTWPAPSPSSGSKSARNVAAIQYVNVRVSIGAISGGYLCLSASEFGVYVCVPVGVTCTSCLAVWRSQGSFAGPWWALWLWPGCSSIFPSGKEWSGRGRSDFSALLPALSGCITSESLLYLNLFSSFAYFNVVSFKHDTMLLLAETILDWRSRLKRKIDPGEPDWKMSTRLIFMIIHHGAQMMRPRNSGDPMSFPEALFSRMSGQLVDGLILSASPSVVHWVPWR